MVTTRRLQHEELPSVWALSIVPHIGVTADPSAPVPLPGSDAPPTTFPDLADPDRFFVQAGGDFLVADFRGYVVGMGGFRPNERGQAEVLRVRVHPALRRRGIGQALMRSLEERAAQLGFREAHLNTATNQPEAMAFYQSMGYQEIGREHQLSWTWTLVHYTKIL